MAFLIFDYVDEHGKNVISQWAKAFNPAQRAKIDNKIDMLALHGLTLHPHTLTGTGVPGIMKLRVHGNVQFRPMLCRGPMPTEMDTSFTLLAGAKEVGGDLKPQAVDSLADARKQRMISNPTQREPHVRLAKATY